MNSDTFTTEVTRAIKFFVAQYKKGWSPDEAYAQTRGHYGQDVAESVLCYLKESLDKRFPATR